MKLKQELPEMYAADGCIEVMCKDMCIYLEDSMYCKKYKIIVDPIRHRFCRGFEPI